MTDTIPGGPIRAGDGLPRPVAAALDAPVPGRSIAIDAGGYRFAGLEWGDGGGRPLLLVHGVTSWAATWWRIGPALAAAGHRVVAPDLPGHGGTGGWRGRHRIRETAEDVVAFASAAGLDRADLVAVGHSWGAMTVAALPGAGLRAARIVQLDPPAAPRAEMAAMLDDPIERRYSSIAVAMATIGPLHPTWSYGDLVAKCVALDQVDPEAVRAVLADNGDWDAGLADLAVAVGLGALVRVVRGEPAAGGLTPDALVPALEALTGPGGVVTIEGGPHSPQRTHPAATVAALLRAIDG